MISDPTPHTCAIEKTSMVVYQVHGNEVVRIPKCFLEKMKGVYGWYVLREDLEILGCEFQRATSDQGNRTPQRIYLYVGSVGDGPRRSVSARFVGELLGAQISSDQQKSFDTDFAVSCVIELLCEKGMNVYFDVLSDVHGNAEEVRIARDKQPILQKVTSRRVCLHSDIKRRMTGNDLADEIAAIRQAVLDRLKAGWTVLTRSEGRGS
jgi:hypothetical protein